jgi:hypothetical protein
VTSSPVSKASSRRQRHAARERRALAAHRADASIKKCAPAPLRPTTVRANIEHLVVRDAAASARLVQASSVRTRLSRLPLRRDPRSRTRRGCWRRARLGLEHAGRISSEKITMSCTYRIAERPSRSTCAITPGRVLPEHSEQLQRVEIERVDDREHVQPRARPARARGQIVVRGRRAKQLPEAGRPAARPARRRAARR